MSSVREDIKTRKAARKFFSGLSVAERWDLGDALVLGGFDWREWGFRKKPSGVFMREVDYQRMLWESSLE